jgi:hypothetical protein
MTSFVIHATGTSTPALTSLVQQVIASGATVSDRSAEVILVGATNLADASRQADKLTAEERHRTVFVGIDDALDARKRPAPDNLAGFVESNRPLAVMSSAIVNWRPERAGFIGLKELAERVGSPIFQLETSPHYGAYMRCDADDAGQFLARYVRIAREGPSASSGVFAEYLRTGNRRGLEQRIHDALISTAATAEAVVWRAWCDGRAQHEVVDGVWAGRRVRIGIAPPANPALGDLWFDVCELSLMAYGGRAWLSTRPVASWQMRGFLEVSKRLAREVQVPPPYTPLDPERLLRANPVTYLTAGEATLYAWWFGKALPHLFDWQAAAETMPKLIDEMWRASRAEWISNKLANDEAARVFVTRKTIDDDPTDLDDESRMIAGEYTQRWDIGFRTAVLASSGLFQTVSSWHILAENVRLAALLDRSTFA